MLYLAELTIDVFQMFLPALVLLGLGAIFALLLGFLGNKLTVKRDERLEQIKNHLAGANCGACGYAGCENFAEALLSGKAKISDCPTTAAEKKQQIMDLLGVSGEVAEDTVAVVRCSGGNNCNDKYDYQGYGSCKTQETLAGGRKACPVGCMGMGTCTDACAFYAVEVATEGYACVNRDKCTSCGRCIEECPKQLIARMPKSAVVYVACSNTGRGKEVTEVCKAGCIGCGICEKACATHAITMQNNLPVFDYSKCTKCMQCAEKCPRKVIKKVSATNQAKTDDSAK